MRLLPVALYLVAIVASARPYTPDPRLAAAYDKARSAGADTAANPLATDPTALTAGAELFKLRCAPCHGEKGKGDGPLAASLDPRPADLTDPARWASTSTGVKRWLLVNGIDGTGMGPTGLTDDEAWRILVYAEATLRH